jgi:Mg-chelatase subunit ChlD
MATLSALPVRWFNIAAAALGGHVERVTSDGNKEKNYTPQWGWSSAFLIDDGVGTPDIGCAPLCGWASKDSTVPQEIVLSFYQHREPVVSRVVIDTVTSATTDSTERLPRQVEISASRTAADDGFTVVSSVELPREPGRRAIDLSPTPAKYLRVRFLSSYGGDVIVVGEISVFEADGPTPSILADSPRNLVLSALGGSIVSYTSEYASHGAYRLIDGDPAKDWRSGGNLHFPQEFVLAFHNDAAALIDRIVFDAEKTFGARVVSVSTSLVSPVDGFEEVGRFTLKNATGEQSFPIQRRARFVKLRILENFGDQGFVSLGEVQLIEGTEPGYESVLSRRTEPAAVLAKASGPSSTNRADVASEHEKNDEVSQANRLDLGAAIQGRIDPVGENDYFKISVPGPDRSVLTVDLSAEPNIRTSLTLVNAAGKVVKQFDPAHVAAEQVAFSWLIDPGEYAVRLTQPPASVVVVWDTSGSMKPSVKDLQAAVEGYLDQVTPAERVNLIRFSKGGWTLTRPDIEVLLPEFSNDRQQLKKATEGKFAADGGTPFYDAVAKALSLLEGVSGNRAIIVMTDGEDAGSHLERNDFWRLLQEKGVRLYTIGLGEIDRYTSQLGSSAEQLLKHAAAATNGRAYFSRNSADLPKFYAEISDDIRKACTYRLTVTRAQATGTLAVRATGERITAVAAPSQIELILDASGSMKRAIGGRKMIDSAKGVLSDIVRQLPDDMHVALRVYGHRVREGRPGACEDSELVFPFAKLNRQTLLSKIQAVQALGTTPIAYSLQQVARDVGQTPGEKMIVLVTDGKEECGGDPAAAVAALSAQGVNVKLNIVGFALADAALKAELRRLAEQTKGQFVEAKDAQSLRSAIEQSLAVSYDVLDASETKIAEGVTGQTAIRLPEGVYTVRIRAEKPVDIARVRIEAQQTTSIELKKEGQELGVRVAAPERQ